MPEQRVDQSELLEVASSLPVDQGEAPITGGEPLTPTESIKVATDQVTALAESARTERLSALLAAGLAEFEGAIASNSGGEPLTRKQLGVRFGKSHETIRIWEEAGKLASRGWDPVPGTGSSPNNPRLYSPITV